MPATQLAVTQHSCGQQNNYNFALCNSTLALTAALAACLTMQSSMRMAAQEVLCRHPSMRLPTTKAGWMWYWLSTCWFEFRWHVRQVVEHPAFDYFFLACIVVNTVLLAMTTAGG